MQTPLEKQEHQLLYNFALYFLEGLIHLNQTERLDQKMGSLALEDGSDSQPSNADISMNQEVRLSLQDWERNGRVWQMPWLFENMR